MLLATSSSGVIILFILVLICLLIVFVKYLIFKQIYRKMDNQFSESSHYYKEQIRLLREQNEILLKQTKRD